MWRRGFSPAIGMVAVALATLAPAQVVRRMALTFDDLPGVSQRTSLSVLEDINTRLLATLRIERIPAVGFVNERGLDIEGEKDARLDLLRKWVSGPFTLGNHTYSHHDVNDVPLDAYQADVLKGEVATRALLKAAGRTLVWFRHPFTHTGPTAEIKRSLDAFLNEHGYRVAPFTVEAADYAFAAVYDRALMAGDQARADQTMAAYLSHQDAMTAFSEALAFDAFGRDIPQVLLAHVNQLNADAMPELLRRLRARGYMFVTLDSAMEDDAYATGDMYVGRNGPSWLHRWRVTLGKPSRLKDEPDPPGWVLKGR